VLNEVFSLGKSCFESERVISTRSLRITGEMLPSVDQFWETDS
jgi:hypothetical protein